MFLFSGIGEDEKSLEGNDKKLVSKIGDYLKADTYMYAPLVISQPWDSVHVSKGTILSYSNRKFSSVFVSISRPFV